jgi:hypothetical protein
MPSTVSDQSQSIVAVLSSLENQNLITSNTAQNMVTLLNL